MNKGPLRVPYFYTTCGGIRTHNRSFVMGLLYPLSYTGSRRTISVLDRVKVNKVKPVETYAFNRYKTSLLDNSNPNEL